MFPVVPRAAGDVIGLNPLTTIFWLLGSVGTSRRRPTRHPQRGQLRFEQEAPNIWNGALFDNGDAVNADYLSAVLGGRWMVEVRNGVRM
jgi:hypothetical protein